MSFILVYEHYILFCLFILGQNYIIFRGRGGNPGNFLRDTNYRIVHDVYINERNEILTVLLKKNP